MKNIIILSALLIAAQFAQAQISAPTISKQVQIGAAKRFGPYAWLKASEGVDTVYQFSYIDEHDVPQVISFKGADAVDQLYQLMHAAVANVDGTRIEFSLGDSPVMLRAQRVMGKNFVWVSMGSGGSTAFNEKQIRQLFNK